MHLPCCPTCACNTHKASCACFAPLLPCLLAAPPVPATHAKHAAPALPSCCPAYLLPHLCLPCLHSMSLQPLRAAPTCCACHACCCCPASSASMPMARSQRHKRPSMESHRNLHRIAQIYSISRRGEQVPATAAKRRPSMASHRSMQLGQRESAWGCPGTCNTGMYGRTQPSILSKGCQL